MHKKWYIQGELFGTKKERKLATVLVGHFSLEYLFTTKIGFNPN